MSSNRKIVDEKACLRKELILRRKSLDEHIRAEKNRSILDNLDNITCISLAKRIFSFVSHGEEVDTHQLLHRLLNQQKHLAVPAITRDKTMIAVAFTDWTELEPGQLGILSPVSMIEDTGDFDVCITPGLGFTDTGMRLGYGRGYYDKWFSRHHCGKKIALAYECQLLDALPVDANDIPVDMIVTENRIIRVS